MSVYRTLKIFRSKVYQERKPLILTIIGIVVLALALWLGHSPYTTHISNITKIEKLKAVAAKHLQIFEKLNAINMAFKIEDCSKENFLINETILGQEVLTLEKNINLENVGTALGADFTKLMAAHTSTKTLMNLKEFWQTERKNKSIIDNYTNRNIYWR